MDGIEVGRLHDHTCVPDPETIKLMKLKNQMKTHAKETMDKTQDILNNAVSGQTGSAWTVTGRRDDETRFAT